MTLTITSRLTATTAVLTLLLFVPAGVGLYLSVASVIQEEGVRRAEAAARDLAFHALFELGNNLMVRYKPGVEPLRLDSLQATDWALVRGNGRVLRVRGEHLSESIERTRPGTSRVFAESGGSIRVGSAPLLPTRPETFAGLPEAVRTLVRQESPDGVFLRAERSAEKGTPILEIDLLEPGFIRELEMTYDGRLIERDTKRYSSEVPPDLAVVIAEEYGVENMEFQSWNAYRGQLIALVTGTDASGKETSLAVNRLGERYLQNQQGDIIGPDEDARLWLVAVIDASAERSAEQSLLFTLSLGLPLLWAAVVLVGRYVTLRAMSPVTRIVDAAKRIGVSHLDERLPVGPVEDELHRISSTINQMLDRIEAGYLRECQFTGDASHELRGPLAKIMADIDLALAKDRDVEDHKATLLRCRRYASSIEELVDSLLWLARLDSYKQDQAQQEFELIDLAAEVVRLLPTNGAARVQLEATDTTTVVRSDPSLIRVMLQNLLQNALRYSPEENPVTLRIGVRDGRARVEVEDTGEGIPEDEIPKVFSRFYRVDKSRDRATGGFGLGLSIVNEIARVQGSAVTLTNLKTGGLQAAFELPLTQSANVPSSPLEID